MASSEDLTLVKSSASPTSVDHHSDRWLYDLARSELHPDAEKLLQLGRSTSTQQLVEESSIEFLNSTREFLNKYARQLNAYSENNSKFQEVKIYSIANTAADFMLFRNQIKLIFSNPAHGVLEISFAQHGGSPIAVNGQSTGASNNLGGKPQELTAQLGPFRDVFWTFQNEKVIPEQVARFYFTEFTQVTRDTKRSRTGNQLLLEQIKALLQQKGLNL